MCEITEIVSAKRKQLLKDTNASFYHLVTQKSEFGGCKTKRKSFLISVRNKDGVIGFLLYPKHFIQ